MLEQLARLETISYGSDLTLAFLLYVIPIVRQYCKCTFVLFKRVETIVRFLAFDHGVLFIG